MTSVAVSHALPTTMTRSRSRPTATTARDACKRRQTNTLREASATTASASLSRSAVMHISLSEAMTNTDLSYLYGVVSALSSAMSAMLMASWFASELTKRKDLTFDYAVYWSTSPLKIELPLS